MKKEIKILLIISLALIILPSVFAVGNNVCCEKTKTGAWCQNSLEENCNNNFRVTRTNCDSTSFCKPGCCVDSNEGLCMENTPERVCLDSAGVWNSDEKCNIPQCSLGCCILGDQASFVTLTRCKKLSGFYGLQTNFDASIKDEVSCILTAQAQDRGACVYTFDNQKTCKLTTRFECSNLNIQNASSGTEFWKDYLCSAVELATNCGATTETMCVEGKDEVYFKDTCGNPANIYDATKVYSRDPGYWQKIVPKSESCVLRDNLVNSNVCGNCDYYRGGNAKGSICSQGSASVGDYSCKDLTCYSTENGKSYRNGESWCVYQGNVGLGRDLVGSRHFRHICINGEEIIEPCADFRNEICLQDNVNTNDGVFIEAACRVNRWEDCTSQTEKEDCLNTDKRDCYRVSGLYFAGNLGEAVEGTLSSESSQVFSGGTTGGFSGGVTGNVVSEGTSASGTNGLCLPEVPPGLRFWGSNDADAMCSLGSSTCSVVYEKGLITGSKVKENEQCLTEPWAAKMNNICTSLGDCGAYINIGNKFTSGGAQWRIQGTKQALSGLLDDVKRKAGL